MTIKLPKMLSRGHDLLLQVRRRKKGTSLVIVHEDGKCKIKNVLTWKTEASFLVDLNPALEISP